MLTAKRRNLIALTVLLAFVLALVLLPLYLHYHKIWWSRELRLYSIASCVSQYIEKMDGRFPGSQDDLVRNGLLRVEPYGDPGKYSVHYRIEDTFFRYEQEKSESMGEGWRGVDRFEQQYHIAYGTQADQLELRNGKLCDKTTGNPVFLISGPFNRRFKDKYETVSKELFLEMMRFHSDSHGNSLGDSPR